MLTAAQDRYLSYLLDPREPKTVPNPEEGTETAKGTKRQFAELLGVDAATLRRWEREPEFIDAWQRRISELSGGPERLQQHLMVLHEIALGKHQARAADRVTAITRHAEMVGTYSPKKRIEVSDPSLARMSDEDILSRIEHMKALIEAKRDGESGTN